MRPLHVTGPIHRLRGLVVSNVWLLDGGRGDRWLVDTGHPIERLTLLAGLRRTGFSPRELSGVLITHRHCDHAGNAGFLRREFGVPILSKIPYINRLFKNVGMGRTTDSLMLMVTPRIIIQEEEEDKLLGVNRP